MSIVYFTDRDLGRQFPDILAAAGLTVERHASHFSPTTPDEEWLAEVGRRRWIAITHDGRIRYKPNELQAVVASGVRLLVVIGHAPHAELANGFVATSTQIERFVRRHDAPWIAKVFRASPAELVRKPDAHGRVELWYPASR